MPTPLPHRLRQCNSVYIIVQGQTIIEAQQSFSWLKNRAPPAAKNAFVAIVLKTAFCEYGEVYGMQKRWKSLGETAAAQIIRRHWRGFLVAAVIWQVVYSFAHYARRRHYDRLFLVELLLPKALPGPIGKLLDHWGAGGTGGGYASGNTVTLTIHGHQFAWLTATYFFKHGMARTGPGHAQSAVFVATHTRLGDEIIFPAVLKPRIVVPKGAN